MSSPSPLEVLEQINEQLTCPICLERYQAPKLLGCLHSFCSHCLNRIANNDPSNIITCPSCREETEIPEQGGIEALTSNFFINNMLDLVKLRPNDNEINYNEEARCETCEESENADTATSRCVDCNKIMCTSCVAEHKRSRSTLDHRIISINDGLGDENQELDKYTLSFCKYHTRNVIKYFCNTCDEAICRVCTILEHREHQYVYPKEALPIQKPIIAEILNKTKSCLPHLKKTLEEVEYMSTKLVQCKEAITKEIKINTQKRVEALLEGQDQLLKQLDTIYTGKEKVLTLQKDSLELELGKISGCCEFAENVLEYGNEVEILQMKTRLELLNDLHVKFEPEEDDTIQYVTDPESIHHVVKTLGQIQASSTFAALSYASGDGIIQARVGIECHFTITTMDRHGSRRHGGDRVDVVIHQTDGCLLDSKVVDEGDGTYTIYYIPEVNGKHQVSVTIQDRPIKDSPFSVLVINRREYEEIGGTLFKFGQYGSKKREFKSPFGVAVDKEGFMYVADSYNHRIQVFGPRGEFIAHFGSHGERKGEFNCPTDVVIDNKGRVIICDNGNNRIQVLTRTGNFVGKFGREGTGNSCFKSPWGVAITRMNEILVADMDNNRVQKFSPDGKYLSKFGSFGDKNGQFNAPCYLLVNHEDDTIIVSDSKNHRIQFFDKSGKFLRQVGNQGTGELQFNHPRGLSMDISGNVIVADMGNHRLQVLTCDGKFVKEIGYEGNGDGQLSFPESVAVSPNSGYIIVSDLSNNRIQVF